MAKVKYATKDMGENTAKAMGIGLNISTKQSIEVCNHIRGMPTTKAKQILNDGVALKNPIPFRRFTNGVGHRRGKIASGAYAPTTCAGILKIVESAEANAQFKGINSSSLIIKHICAQRGASQYRYGRKARQAMKVTNIEIVVEEGTQKIAKVGKVIKTDKKPVKEKIKEVEKTVEKLKKDAKKKDQKEEASEIQNQIDEIKGEIQEGKTSEKKIEKELKTVEKEEKSLEKKEKVEKK